MAVLVVLSLPSPPVVLILMLQTDSFERLEQQTFLEIFCITLFEFSRKVGVVKLD